MLSRAALPTAVLSGVFGVLVLVLVLALDAHSARAAKSAVLKVTASPRIAEIPAKIQFHAFIEGGRDDDPKLYCPDVVWDFQHAVFRDTRDCPEYEKGTRIQRAYETEHTFETEGIYQVEVRLVRRGRVVLSGHVEVRASKTGFRGR